MSQGGDSSRRRAQVVAANSQRRRVIEWMFQRDYDPMFNGSVIKREVNSFPLIFSQRIRSANREKARD